MKAITVFGTNIRKDADGRFSLNDLHKAAMAKGHATQSQRPGNFIKSAKQFLDAVNDNATVVAVKKQTGKGGGTYASELVALRYAAWISASVEVPHHRWFAGVSRYLPATKKPWYHCCAVARLPGFESGFMVCKFSPTT